jgi:integrase
MNLTAWTDRYLSLQADWAEGTEAIAQTVIGRLKSKLGATKPMRSITPAMATDWGLWLRTVKSTRGQLSPATVAIHLRGARAIFECAKAERVITDNPFASVKMPKQGPPPEWRMVTLPELELILAACPDQAWSCLFALCRLAGLRSGIRGGEALGLTWDDVDWQGRTLRAQDQKRGKVRTVPICPRLYEILRAAFEARDGATVCPVDRGSMDRKAREIIAAAGIGAYSKPMHSLRKSLESQWLSEGRPILDVCRWLGNSPAIAIHHYSQPSPQSVAAITGLR